MAINKNFVIKNGVEVNTNLLVGDSTLNKVGIATTVPGYTLHIGVGDGARGGIGATDITVTGIATIGVANSNSAALSVTGISTFEGLIDANGGLSARTAAVQDLTNGNVVLAGAGGELEDSDNLTFDGSTLTVTGDLDPTNVSIASTLRVVGVATFLSDVRVAGAATVGVLTVTGDAVVGGDLIVSGDYVTDEITARNLNLTGIATIPTLGVTGIATAETLQVGNLGLSVLGITTFTGNADFNGDLDVDGTTNLDVVDIDGAVDMATTLTVGGNVDFNGDLDVDGTANLDVLDVDGASNFGADVVFAGAGSTNITFDQDVAALRFDDKAHATFGADRDFAIFHTGSETRLDNDTGDLKINTASGAVEINKATNDFMARFITDGAVELYHDNVKIFQTTGIGITVGLSSIQHNGNAAFPGITTLGGILNANGVANFNSDVDLGSSSSDTITANGRFDSNLVPSGDTQDLGTSSQEWRDLFIDGIAHLDNIEAGIGTFSSNLLVSGISTFTGAIDANGGATIDNIRIGVSGDNEIDTSTGNLTLDSDGGTVVVADNLSVQDGLTVTNTSTLNGNVNIGNNTADAATIAGNVTIAGVTTTGENLGGFKRLVGAASSTVVSIAVTVATKTSDHRYFGQGSANGYWLDGVQSPFLTLVPGKLYYFDQSHSTNSGHPLRFYLEQDKANAYTTEITTGGTPGSSGAYTQIGIGTASNENNHPAVLHYQCSAHGLMGNAVATQSNTVNLPDGVHNVIRGGLVIGGNLIPDSDDERNIGAAGSEFKDLHLDGTANIDVLDVDNGANISGGLVANSAKISDLTNGRVVFCNSGDGQLADDADLTFDGQLLKVGLASISAIGNAQFQGITTIGGALDVNSTSNFGGDVVFDGDSANITFDKSEDDLIFGDNAQAIFGGSPGSTDGLHIFHDGNHSQIQDQGTGNLYITGNASVNIDKQSGEQMANFVADGEVELFHNDVKIFQTTGIGITVGLSSVQHNGNAAFPGITTLGSPGSNGSRVIVNNLLIGNSGANISGIATLTTAYIGGLVQSNGDSGSANEVPVANGSGGWNWAPVNTAGASDIQGITVQEEGSNVGTAGSINTINFTGNDVTASVSGQTAIVNVNSNIQGISTANQSYLHDITQTGVTTITSDQEAAINVGTSATIYKAGNIRTVGVITARGGLVIGDTTDASSGGGLLVATSAGVGLGTIKNDNGNAAFAGIVTAGGGFNIGIQSAGIVIAKNVGINTLNFVGSGNSITYFAATNTLDVSIAGSSGGGGGVSETETAVSSTSATSTGSFAKASFRSASILAQITQGSAYQVGRYLLIHDGTTVTTIEESAVATGSMLGTFEGVINGSNVEFRVTMSSSSSATVTTKIDTISIP